MKMSGSDKFKVGGVYVATPAIEGQPCRLAVVIGIAGPTVQVAFVDELANGEIGIYWEHETAKIETDIGQYNISAAIPAAAQESAVVMDILKARRTLPCK